ncbi:MAG: beta-glucosidase [Pedobacter sp.]|nr:MAG: beta-glucosidase [Pedobacter sp.]
MSRTLYLQLLLIISILTVSLSCKKNSGGMIPVTDTSLSFTVNDVYNGSLNYTGLGSKPVIKINLTEPVNSNSLSGAIKLTGPSATPIAFTATLQNGDKTILIVPQADLSTFTAYTLSVSAGLLSSSGGKLVNPVSINLTTGFSDTDKFPRITDDELLTLVQKQTFKYFYDFGHPVSGMARERNTSGNTVTSGGSGFGLMALVVGVERNFVNRADGLARVQKIVDFLKNKAVRFHGAYSHWIDGNTGAVIPFSSNDDGGDLVETSFLMEGLITARQYFNSNTTAESTLRNDITSIYNGVEWDWYRKNNSNTLYWHWSPNFNFDKNVQLRGWNEALVTYVLAASSPTHSIPKSVYDAGWANNGGMKNGSTFYGVQLPLGPANGGPLFFEHYSFLGINPIGLSDVYANYETQAKAHTLINYNYCVANPLKYYGYGENCWGLTASDIPSGYTASSPSNDVGVIAPTAALSSFPYMPTESMKALKFFYYKIGDKLWGEYGFYDAFSPNQNWFASSTLAIDQGPIIIMIENYRTQLLWKLFMSAPEVKTGMRNLGFNSPAL